MLVLTRKLEEKIQIGPDVTITILRIKGRSVQVGIEAPSRVQVLRGELAAAADLRAEATDLACKTPLEPAAPKTLRVSEPTRQEPSRKEPKPKGNRRLGCRSGAPGESRLGGDGGLVSLALSHF